MYLTLIQMILKTLLNIIQANFHRSEKLVKLALKNRLDCGWTSCELLLHVQIRCVSTG